MENFTQIKLRIITWEQLLTKLWGLFHPLEVKAQLYKFLRQKSESVSCSIMSDSCDPTAHQSGAHQLLCPWNSPVKNTGVGSYSLFQLIFLTQGSNPGLPAL